MDRRKFVVLAGWSGLVGGLAWLLSISWLLFRPEGAFDTVCFFVGLAGAVVCGAGAGAHLACGRGGRVSVFAAVAGALLFFLAVPALSIVSSAAFGEGTFIGDEGGLLVLALVVLIVGAHLVGRVARTASSTPTAARRVV